MKASKEQILRSGEILESKARTCHPEGNWKWHVLGSWAQTCSQGETRDGEGIGGALGLAGGPGPASANSCQGRRPCRCSCHLAPLGCLGPQWGQRGDYRRSGAPPPARASGVLLALSSFPVSMADYSQKPQVGWQHQLQQLPYLSIFFLITWMKCVLSSL